MRWSIVLALGAATTACSLLVSTSGLEGGGDASDGGTTPPGSPDAPAPPPNPPPPPGADGSSSGGDADTDAAPADPTLVASWSFEETAGAVAHDSTGHGHDAAFVGAPTFGSGGVKGGCVHLHGGDHLEVASLAGALSSSGTFSAWFRDDAPISGGNDREILDGWDKTRAHVFVRHVSGEPATQYQAALQPVTTAGDYSFVSGFTITASTWTNIVVTWDATAKVGGVYVNGSLAKSYAYAYDFAPTQQVFHMGDSLTGELDEVRLWSRVLSSAEVAALQ